MNEPGSPASDDVRASGMSSARWRRVQDVFELVLDRALAERPALLKRECADDEDLRREVESLLAGHERTGVVDELGGELSAPALWRARVDSMEQRGRRVGRYVVLEQLGAGGMGFVYKAHDERLNRHVALKFLPPHLGVRADAKARFLAEARAAARLDHPNICTIHEIGETPDGQLFIAMALYDGETLERRLERTPTLAFNEAVAIALQISVGLAKSHEHGIVHRDVKPSNVMLAPDGSVKILDFGIARVEGALLATQEHGALGTVAYMSPEQVRGERVDARTDVWSLGVVLYEMIAGQRPFREETAHALRQEVLTATPKALTEMRAELPIEIDAVLNTALAKDPDERYPSMARVTDDLTTLLERERPDARLAMSAPVRGAEAERRRAAVLVCLVPEYAALVERLTPQELEQVMSQIRAAAVEVVRRYGGLVNHTLDEEIVALFGAPATHEDDDLRAVRAALDLLARVAALSVGLKSESAAAVSLQCGVHSGVLVTRRLSAGPQRYALTGRPLQVATRLAAFAPSNTVLISPDCARLVSPFVVSEPHESVAIDADTGSMTAHRVVGASGLQTRIEAAARKGLTPLAGRSSELSMVETHFAHARTGNGQVVLLVGEAGVGKSRLLHELRERVAGMRAQVLQARCRSYGVAPYLPFADILRDALRLRTDEGSESTAADVVQRLHALDPSLEQFAPLYLQLSLRGEAPAPARQLRGEHLRESVSEALAAILVAVARSEPTALLLEDWHWSDEGSNETLRRLLEIVPSAPMLIVITSRPEGVARMPATANAARIQLGPLDFESSAAVMRSVLGVARVSEALARRVYERSGGNPFFIEEVCHTLLEQGSVALVEGEGVAAHDVEALHIPETVQAVIRTRLDGLDKDALEVLRVASVIGREFTHELLMDVTATNAQARPALERLKSAGLIQQISVVPDVAYRFKHVLTQEVTYDSLLTHQRRRLHGEIGRAMEARAAQGAGERAELLAYHYTRAEDWAPAVHHGRRAAERASALSQFADALAMLDRVQECIANLAEDDARRDLTADVLLQQERLCETLGQRGRQQQIVADLIALLAPCGASARLGLAYLRQGDLQTLLRRFDAAHRALSTALRMSREQGDAGLERHALRSIGLLRWHEGRHEDALEITQSALAIDRERGDALAAAGDLANLGVIYKSMGDYPRALASFEDALSMPALAQDPSTLVYSLQNVANVYRELGELDRALEYLERGNEISRAHLMPIQRSFHLMAIAHVLLQQKRIAESLATYRESIELSRRANHADGLVQSLRALGEVLFTLGRDAEAAPLLQEAAELFAALEDRFGEVEMLSRVATILERGGEAASAVEIWRKVRSRYAELGDAHGELRALEGIARAVRRSGGASEEAIAHAAAALTLASTLGDTPREMALRNTLGILEWEQGRYEAALSHYEIALGFARALRDRAGEGLILNSLGVTLTHLNRGEEARTVLEESVAVNARSGEQLLEAHALAALGEVRSMRGAAAAARECFERSLALRRALDDAEGERRMLERIAQLVTGD